jgi:hypothetical protein
MPRNRFRIIPSGVVPSVGIGKDANRELCGDCLALFRKEPERSLDTPMDMEASTAQVVAGAFAARASILDGLVVLGLEAR